MRPTRVFSGIRGAEEVVLRSPMGTDDLVINTSQFIGDASCLSPKVIAQSPNARLEPAEMARLKISGRDTSLLCMSPHFDECVSCARGGLSVGEMERGYWP